jgi:hypothetical protein
MQRAAKEHMSHCQIVEYCIIAAFSAQTERHQPQTTEWILGLGGFFVVSSGLWN